MNPSNSSFHGKGPFGQNRAIRRRAALVAGIATAGVTAGAGTALAAGTRDQARSLERVDRRQSLKRHRAKKSINLWAFPYPDQMSLRECMQLAKDAGFHSGSSDKENSL